MQQYCELDTNKGKMRGYFHVPNKDKFPVVIMFHGFTGNCNGDKFSYVTLSRRLEEKGVGSIRLDFLGTGSSDLSFKEMTFDDELSCARIILEEMKSLESVTDIYVLGHSMGGCIASELSKLYPNDIKKMILWAPAFNLPEATKYLNNNETGKKYYDHNGFEISETFMIDITSRNFYMSLDTFKNDILVIHGDQDTTVPYKISENYMALFVNATLITIKGMNHTFDNVDHLNQLLNETEKFILD